MICPAAAAVVAVAIVVMMMGFVDEVEEVEHDGHHHQQMMMIRTSWGLEERESWEKDDLQILSCPGVRVEDHLYYYY